MQDLIREIQATIEVLGVCVDNALYEHKERNLLTMALHYGVRYTLDEVRAWYYC
jgi:hypothetical protein